MARAAKHDGKMVGGRLVVRELPRKVLEGGGKKRYYLLRCPKCGLLSRCKRDQAVTGKHVCAPTEDKVFVEVIAPAIAESTSTVYGGAGRFWKEYADGDVRLKFTIRYNGRRTRKNARRSKDVDEE